MEQLVSAPTNTNPMPVIAPPPVGRPGRALVPQHCGEPGCQVPEGVPVEGNGRGAPAYVYAIGRIVPRLPSLAVEKEFAQATGRAETAGLTDSQAFYEVLTQRQNRYLARQLCWVLTIEGLETYILAPRDPADIDVLLEGLRREPGPLDVDVVVGVRGPIAPAQMCNGLMVPIVIFDQIYSFTRDELIAALPRPESYAEKEDARFRSAAGEVYDRIIQLADNAGAIDEHRALNYLAVRYPAIYAQATEKYSQNFALTGVEARPSRLSGVRKIVDVIFTYANRNTDVREMYFVRVDVTEQWPFLVTKLSPYFDR